MVRFYGNLTSIVLPTATDGSHILMVNTLLLVVYCPPERVPFVSLARSLSEHRKDTCQTRKTRYRSRKCDKMARHAHKGKLIYLQHRVRVEGVGAHSAAEEFSVTGQAAAGHGLVLCGRAASSSQAGKKLCDNRRGTHTHTPVSNGWLGFVAVWWLEGAASVACFFLLCTPLVQC